MMGEVFTNGEHEMGEEDAHITKSLGMRIQKKIASKMATKGLAKQVVDGPTCDVIDNSYRIAKMYLGNKKEAEKITKNTIKIVVKVAILSRNNQFSNEDIKVAEAFQRKFNTIAKTVISFYEVDFTFDKDYLHNLISEAQGLIEKLVKSHLTDKSLRRVEHVFGFYKNTALLEALFTSNSPYRPYLGNMVTAFNALLESGEI